MIPLIAITSRGHFEFGELWQGAGLGFELLSAAACKADEA